MLLNLFTAIMISAPKDVYVAECKQFGVYIAGDDFFETSNLPRSSSVRIRKKILFKNVNGVLFYSLQSAPTSVFTHRNVNSFIARAGESQVNSNYVYPAVSFSVPFFRAIW